MLGMWRTALGLAAGACIVGGGLAACGTANPVATASSASGTVVASPSRSELPHTSTSTSVVPSAASTLPATPSSTSGSTAPSGSAHFGRPGAELTLTGTVEAGVEASCLILRDEKTGRQVNLNGGNKDVRLGVRVTVVGRIRNDLMSFCQQGPIFVVSSATVR
jgi:hypothetical protein